MIRLPFQIQISRDPALFAEELAYATNVQNFKI